MHTYARNSRQTHIHQSTNGHITQNPPVITTCLIHTNMPGKSSRPTGDTTPADARGRGRERMFGEVCARRRRWPGLEAGATYLVQFSRYKIFSDTVMSQMLSTVRCRAALASRKDAVDSDILSGRLLPPPPPPSWSTDGCRLVEASGGRCCWYSRPEAVPPSMARKMNEPNETANECQGAGDRHRE